MLFVHLLLLTNQLCVMWHRIRELRVHGSSPALLLQILLCSCSLLPMMLFVSTVPKDIRENLISLRDYEFVGEDKRLAVVLAERMAGLDNTTERDDVVEQDDRPSMPIPSAPVAQPVDKIEPDQLSLNPKTYPRMNVSLDYAEYFNISGAVKLGANATWLSQVLGLNKTGGGSRRAQEYYDTVYNWDINMKIMDIMKQNIYSVQNRLAEVEFIILKYQKDERFRMAFIFNRLDEWKRDIRTIHYALKLKRSRANRWRFKLRLWYYEHLLRKNIDITYSVEFLIHLHSKYMANVNKIMPRDQLAQMHKLSQLKKQAGINQTAMDFLKKNTDDR